MRVVGDNRRPEFAATPEEAMARGLRLDAMTRLPGLPDFQPRGVFRGTHAFFVAMDEAKALHRQAWFLSHAKRSA